MTSGGLAARYQVAGDKHDNAVPEHVLPKEPNELQRGTKDQQCGSGQKQECASEPECASGQTECASSECASGQAEWASSGKQPQPMQQMPQGAGAAAAASVKATLQKQAAAKK